MHRLVRAEQFYLPFNIHRQDRLGGTPAMCQLPRSARVDGSVARAARIYMRERRCAGHNDGRF
jgi:hypothetical protein